MKAFILLDGLQFALRVTVAPFHTHVHLDLGDQDLGVNMCP